ncbi:MAG TPA: Flp pilus assembly protein CpaB [Pirellulaceae bacterium]|nr:Flp pilus assembly protein CpaB [Pirellulaceae bacterium]
MKSKSLILMVISLGFGVVAAVGISQVLGGSKPAKPKEVKTATVVVAKEIIEIDGLLTEDNCQVENWPAEIVPLNALKSLEEIKDKAVTTRIGKGLPLLGDDVVDKQFVVSLPIPHGYRAQAIKVAADGTIDGLIRPGDRIDVIVVYNEKRGNVSHAVAKTFLKNVQVFSIDRKTRRDSAISREAAASASKGTSILSILVTEKQTEELALAQRMGTLQIALRGPEETDTTDYDSLLDWLNQSTGDGPSGNVTSPPPVITSPLPPLQNDGFKPVVTRIWHGNQWAVTIFDETGKPFAQYDLNNHPQGSGSSTNPIPVSNHNESDDSEDQTDNSGVWDPDQYRDG